MVAIKKSVWLLSIAVLLLLLALTRCKKHNDPVVQYDVYAFGSEFKENDAAAYWKNGEIVLLTDGSKVAWSASAAVSGTDVYIAGNETNPSGKVVAKYWKNGVAVNLSGGTQNAYATDIQVNGSDVYVSGWEVDASGNVIVKYWKNGTSVALASSSHLQTAAIGIALQGSDVHVIGQVVVNDSVLAKYWKNGIEVPMKPTEQFTYLNDIAIAGNDIYIVGYAYNSSNKLISKFWKNGLETPLSGCVYAKNVSVTGNDVYVAGQSVASEAAYWKDGTPFYPNDEAISASTALSVAAIGSDVIVSGSNSSGSFLWKNGITENAPFDGTDNTVHLEGAIVAVK